LVEAFFIKTIIYITVFTVVLRRIFGPRRDKVTGEWRRLHNEELMICTPHPILCG